MSGNKSDLIHRFRRGDEGALRELLDGHSGILQAHVERYLPSYLQRRVAVSDIIQETRIVAFQRCGDFEDRGEGAFSNWVLGIARRKIHQAVERHLGAAKRAAGKEVSRAGRADTGQFASGDPSPSQVAMGMELADLALEALRLLPRDHREVLRLAREEQLPLREVADRIGRSYEATRRFYSRALRRLAEVLDGLMDEAS